MTEFTGQWMTTLCKAPDEQFLSALGTEVDMDEDGTYYIMLLYNIADDHKQVCQSCLIVCSVQGPDFDARIFY